MSEEPIASLDLIQLIGTIRETIETSGTQKAIELFSQKAMYVIQDKLDVEATKQALNNLYQTLADKSGEEIEHTISQINTIAKQHNIPIAIGFTRPPDNNAIIDSLKKTLVDAGVFEMLEQYADADLAFLDIDNSTLIVKYLAYLQHNITDIRSLNRYLRTCIMISQVDDQNEKMSIIDQYVTSAALDTDDTILAPVFDTYEYLDVGGKIAKDYLAECLSTGISPEDAYVELEAHLRVYAWIHMMIMIFDDEIIAPRTTHKESGDTVEYLSDTDRFRVYERLNDWLDVLDPERYIPERLPTGNIHHVAMYERIAGEHFRILH